MRRLLSLLVFVPILSVSPVQAQKQFGFDNRKPSGQPYLKPEETVAKMKVADGFEVKLFAGEPQLVNPIAMTVDEKGRVWVIECFEYPKRTPKGKMPRDRIIILEDTDGDGVCDKRTVFAEGKDFPVPFDLASGIEVGYGGVYVGAPPYLFFIENKNDKPGKFEVLLKGFGSQDTHETLNTFQWGPDGWLYGLHGVFTHSEVKPEQADGPGTRLNAAVWRFHPKTKKFEIFSEGTSNPWGMDWRNTDGQFILCCCVIPHLYHMVPGGIYRRQGGQSFNPYAYGEIKEICDHTFHKESGWAHAGLISLDTPIMPEKYRNSVIFGSIHGSSLKQNILKPNGSTYTASRGDDFLVSGDKNFRPINLRWGPNGEIYCIDWHDQNPCHQTNAEDWDYERGRVYRIQPKGLKTSKNLDFGALSSNELARAFAYANPYEYRTALRLLAERNSEFTAEQATTLADIAVNKLKERKNPNPLRMSLLMDFALRTQPLPSEWTEPKVDEKRREPLSRDIQEDVAFQFRIFDTPPGKIIPWAAKAAAHTVKSIDSVVVRREAASLAIKVVNEQDVSPLLHELLSHREDTSDPILPILLWTAFEKQLIKAHQPEVDWLRDNAADNALITDYIIPRVMRRLVATGKADDLSACVAFARDLKDYNAKLRALDGLVEALKGRQVDAPANWKEVRIALLKDPSKEIQSLVNKLAINFRDADAIKRSLAIATDATKSLQERIDAIRDLALATPPAAIQPLLRIAKSENAEELRAEAIRALSSFEGPALAKELLENYASSPRNLKSEIVNVLAGRKEWAKELLDAVGAKKIAPTDLHNNVIMRIQALKDKKLDAQIEKVWGRLRTTPAELMALINKTRGELYGAKASFARGKIAFDTHCAKCHKFEGRGSAVGPDIEGAGRDIEYLLVNVLDPNRVIGAPYFIRTVTKLNGQNETGLLAAEDDQTLTLKMENGVLKVIPKKDIEEVRIQEKSLMPEGFGSNIKIQELRDLIRYVMANPFITEVQVNSSTLVIDAPVRSVKPVVGVQGRIPITDVELNHGVTVAARVTAPEAMKTKLLLGIRNDVAIEVTGSGPRKLFRGKGSGRAAQPDQVEVEVDLEKGENLVLIMFEMKEKDDAIYARFHDPNRKLRYAEPADEKK